MSKKEKGIKHEHTMTNFLKATIFGLVMLAPFLAILSKVIYTTYNENAYQSYSGTYKFNYVDVVTFNELQVGNNYVGSINFSNFSTDKLVALNSNLYTETNNSFYANNISITFDNLEINTDSTIHYNTGFSSSSIINTIKLINYYVVGGGFGYLWTASPDSSNYNTLNNNQMICLFNDSDYIGYINIKDLPIVNIQGSISSINNNYSSFNPYFSNLTQYISVVDNTLSSVFYSAIDELDHASIFSWTTDTAIYDAISNMTESLGVVSPPLAVLLTYWTIITAIYVVIDIVLETFIFLTHWFNDKMI